MENINLRATRGSYAPAAIVSKPLDWLRSRCSGTFCVSERLAVLVLGTQYVYHPFRHMFDFLHLSGLDRFLPGAYLVCSKTSARKSVKASVYRENPPERSKGARNLFANNTLCTYQDHKILNVRDWIQHPDVRGVYMHRKGVYTYWVLYLLP